MLLPAILFGLTPLRGVYGTEVVKQAKDPKLGSAIYPIMEPVDENYIGQATYGAQADMELGGIDQRKIFCFRKNGIRSQIMVQFHI